MCKLKKSFVSVATTIDGGFVMAMVEYMYTPSAGLTGSLLLLFSTSAAFILGKTEITG